jgi:hypothetical protein
MRLFTMRIAISADCEAFGTCAPKFVVSVRSGGTQSSGSM